MTMQPLSDDPIQQVALLDEPTRRRLYQLVVARHEPVGRDDAAAAVGISRELAAFHLDRLADAGLLQVEFRRRSGRSGPGAGRPAKLYRRAEGDVALSLPPRHYDLAADLMATALERLDSPAVAETLTAVAHQRGDATGSAVRKASAPGRGRGRSLARLVDVLRSADYEPEVDPSTGTVTLRNCPYHAIATEHRELTCGMNLAWAEGVVEGLGAKIGVELSPQPGRCCVVFHTGPSSSLDATPPAIEPAG